MVSGLTENGEEKVSRYWPRTLFNEASGNGECVYGDIAVAVLAGRRSGGHIESTFRVRRGEEERIVLHFWFDTWPDHGLPKVSFFSLSLSTFSP